MANGHNVSAGVLGDTFGSPLIDFSEDDNLSSAVETRYARFVNLRVPTVEAATTLTFEVQYEKDSAWALQYTEFLVPLSLLVGSGGFDIPVPGLSCVWAVRILTDTAQTADRTFELYGAS